MYGQMTPEQKKQLNELLSMATIKSDGSIDGEQNPVLANLMGARQQAPASQMPRNYIQRGSTGEVIDMDFAAPGGGAVRHDVWADGPREVARRALPDGRTEVTRRVPTYDGDGRQTTVNQAFIETPDYLNPSKLEELKYAQAMQGLQGGKKAADSWMKVESNGKLFQLNSRTGEILPMQHGGQQLEGPGMAKVRKEQSLAKSTRDYAEQNASMIETSLADILGTTPDKLPQLLGGAGTAQAQANVAPAVGLWDSRMPTALQRTRNIESAIENLKSKAQMFGLANLRKSGVAPGSITEKEWPKFESTLGNIDMSLGEPAFIKQMQDLYRQVKSAREGGVMDYQTMTEGMPQEAASGGNLTPEDQEAFMWATQNPQDPRAAAIKARLGAR